MGDCGVHFDLSDLRLFLHLAECGNLTRGASAAALSPAAASIRLKSLEGQLNARLFYRDSKGLSLTYAGELLQRHARAVMRQIDHVHSDFLALASDSVGHFRIFANTTPITDALPPALALFMRDRPQVTVDIRERNTREVIRSVIDSAADIGVLSVPSPFCAGELQHRLFATDRLVLVVPPDHELCGCPSVRFEETVALPHVGFQESTLQSYLLEQAAQLNKRLSMRVLMSSYETMCGMIAAGVGVGILPESSALRYIRTGMALRIVRLSDDWSLRERHVIYRDFDALPVCAKAFVETLISLQRPPASP
jgi:DNA-binding transcriptional LysR family regulator